MKKLIVSLFLFVLIFSLTVVESSGMPAFARKYKMSCTTCHAPFPRLKAYGDEFAGNGFELEDEESPRYFVETGDPELDLIRDLQIGFRLEGYALYKSVTENNVDFTSPYLLKIMSGGSLTQNVAYYFYFYFNERGEVAGVEDAYLMFNNLWIGDFDIYIGQFQVSDPLFKRELRLTMEDYHAYKFSPGASRINLAYDRGIMLTYGLDTGTSIILEAVNGNGLVHANQNKVYDDDEYKCYAARISQDIGDFLRVGGFAYLGKEGAEGMEILSSDTITFTRENEVMYWGPDVTLAGGPFEVNFQYLQRNDSNPNFSYTIPNEDIVTNAMMGELIFSPHGDKSKWFCAALYNSIDSDLDELDYTSVAGHYSYMLKTNIRLSAEVGYDLDNEDIIAGIGFVTGF
ncbi:hypothetical protein K8I28_16265 [bacterium]|nr:hypothetical protein [bacterium]